MLSPLIWVTRTFFLLKLALTVSAVLGFRDNDPDYTTAKYRRRVGAAAGGGQVTQVARVALLEELMEHPFALVKELSWLMKVQAAMTLFGTPSIRARSGYDRGREEKMPVRLRVKKDGSMKEVA